jgi:hypothetical protein
MNLTRNSINVEYRKAAQVALAIQIPAAILCMLVLDGGYTARVCGIAILAFWLVAAIIASRRPSAPSAVDLWYWRWGFVPCFMVTFLLAALSSNY